MRSDYGARAMLELAEQYGKGPVQSAEIASRRGVPDAYLEQLLTTLRKAGLVRSTRGPHGGHELARAPSEITMADIVLALEGSIAPLDCMDDAWGCQITPACALQEVWRAVRAATLETLRSYTIDDLAARQRSHQGRVMYHI